jgi:rhodanese-related sulfurtransferase
VDGATRVDVHTAKTFFDRNVLFFDLQGGNPYSVLTIPGAVRGNVLKMTRRSLSSIASKDQEIVFFERHYRYIGQAEAAAKAVYWGYTSIYHMHGGVWEWRDAGYPVEKR